MTDWDGIYIQFDKQKAEIDRLRAENAKLRAALERLIKDYEDETGEKAMAARAALNEETK